MWIQVDKIISTSNLCNKVIDHVSGGLTLTVLYNLGVPRVSVNGALMRG